MEERSELRFRAVLKAEIRYNDGMMSSPRIVRDLSEHGARLELPGEIALPDRFELYVEKKHKTYRAVVRRRSGKEIGVALQDTASSPPDTGLADRVAKLEDDVAELRGALTKIAAASGTSS